MGAGREEQIMMRWGWVYYGRGGLFDAVAHSEHGRVFYRVYVQLF
jgi:hypothetical protein